MTLERKSEDYEINGENIFLVNKNENEDFSTISMFNSNLEKVGEFGQADQSLPYFFSDESCMVSDDFFITIKLTEDLEETEKDTYKITVINRTNGFVEKSFFLHDLYCDKFQLYLNKFILTFDNETRLLNSYNLKGDLISEITLDGKLIGSRIYLLNKELCFITYDDKILIF